MRPLLPALALILAACATGDSIAESAAGPGSGPGGGDGGASGGGGDGGDGSRSSGPGATTSATTTGGGTTSSTSSSALASSSSSGTPCDQDPCKLIAPQCGCEAGDMCTLVGADERGCVEEGTQAPGQQCSGSSGDCRAGAVCVYMSGTGNTKLDCAAFCETDAQCAGQGSWCALELSGVDDIKLCSQNCDPVTGSGCAIAGTKCTLGYVLEDDRHFTICTGTSGGGGQFDPCTVSENCGVGFECLEILDSGGDRACFQWCSSAAPNCPDGLTCQQFDPAATIGGISYGVCSG